jgi:hypothetical protein
MFLVENMILLGLKIRVLVSFFYPFYFDMIFSNFVAGAKLEPPLPHKLFHPALEPQICK